MANVTVPVSVVIPMHNSEQTIQRALASVLNQSALPREIIIVDDCSTDSSHDVVSTLKKTSVVNIQLIKLEENLGPSATRNIGWNAATSEFVAFLDSDDSWHRKKLEIQVRWMKGNPDCVISGHLTGWSPAEIDELDQPIQEFGLVNFLIRNRVSTPTVMLRHSLEDRFDEAMWYAEDFDLWVRILSRHGKLTRIEVPLTQLHKADFGESGLSSHLYPMFRGELRAIAKLHQSGNISLITALTTSGWMTAKYALRVAKTKLRRIH